MADILCSGVTGSAVAAKDGRLDNAGLTNLEAGDVGAKLLDHARELVTKRDGNGVAGDRMGVCRAEVGASQVFMKVGSADADECWSNLKAGR